MSGDGSGFRNVALLQTRVRHRSAEDVVVLQVTAGRLITAWRVLRIGRETRVVYPRVAPRFDKSSGGGGSFYCQWMGDDRHRV